MIVSEKLQRENKRDGCFQKQGAKRSVVLIVCRPGCIDMKEERKDKERDDVGEVNGTDSEA